MDELYLVYSARSQGWITNSGQYNSDMKEARRMPRATAILLCRTHKQKAGYAAIPVRLADMEEVG